MDANSARERAAWAKAAFLEQWRSLVDAINALERTGQSAVIGAARERFDVWSDFASRVSTMVPAATAKGGPVIDAILLPADFENRKRTMSERNEALRSFVAAEALLEAGTFVQVMAKFVREAATNPDPGRATIRIEEIRSLPRSLDLFL